MINEHSLKVKSSHRVTL